MTIHHEIGKIDPALFAGDLVMRNYFEQLDAKAAQNGLNTLHYFLPLIDSTPENITGEIVKAGYTPSSNSDGPSRIVRGMASVKSPDRGKDEVEPDAFRSSIEDFMNKNPIMFYNHDWSWPIGSAFKAAITPNGLYFEGELDSGNEVVDRVWNWVQKKIVRAISPSFRILEYSFKDDSNPYFGGRIIKNLELLEISLVTIPKQADALLDTYKGYAPSKSTFFDQKSMVDDAVKTRKNAQAKITHLICSKSVDLADKSASEQFDSLACELKSVGAPVPEKRKYKRIEAKEFFEGKKYEFNLAQGANGQLFVWENSTKCWHEFDKMPRFLKKHIKQSEIFQSLVKIEKGSDGAEKYSFNTNPVNSFVLPSIPNEIVDIGADRFSITNVPGAGILVNMHEAHIDGFIKNIPSFIEKSLSQNQNNDQQDNVDTEKKDLNPDDNCSPDNESVKNSQAEEGSELMMQQLGELKSYIGTLAKKLDDHRDAVQTTVQKILSDKYRTGEIWHGRD